MSHARTSTVGRLAALRILRGSLPRSQEVRANAAAFAAVYERHHLELYRYCRSLLHNHDDAQDALQSAMAKAFAALHSEERDFELRPWLFRIAHNEAVSRLRRRREIVDLDAAAGVGRDSLDRTIEDRERLALLQADLGDLPERQRAALVLRELSGLGHAEIAAVLDSTPAAIKQTIFEARVALNQCAEGREMTCAEVQRILSDGDGRVVRSRRIRAHVTSCRSCREFKAALARRPDELAALAPPLPVAAGAALLAHLLPGAKASVASGAGAAVGGGGTVAATLTTKAAVIVATSVVVAGGATAAHEVATPAPAAKPHSGAAAGAKRLAPTHRDLPRAPASPSAAAPRVKRADPAHSASGARGHHRSRSAHRGRSATAPGHRSRRVHPKPVHPTPGPPASRVAKAHKRVPHAKPKTVAKRATPAHGAPPAKDKRAPAAPPKPHVVPNRGAAPALSQQSRRSHR